MQFLSKSLRTDLEKSFRMHYNTSFLQCCGSELFALAKSEPDPECIPDPVPDPDLDPDSK